MTAPAATIAPNPPPPCCPTCGSATTWEPQVQPYRPSGLDGERFWRGAYVCRAAAHEMPVAVFPAAGVLR